MQRFSNGLLVATVVGAMVLAVMTFKQGQSR